MCKKSGARMCWMAALAGVTLMGMAASGAWAAHHEDELLTRTLSEEKTEIAQLTAQAARFKQMGGSENTRIAEMLNRWVREHKAASPTLEKLTRKYKGNPANAKTLKAPVLGNKAKMLHATMVDHMKAVQTSKERAAKTNAQDVKKAMQARIALATRHMREMEPFHSAKNCPQCAQMMKGGAMKGGAKQGAGMSGKRMAAMCPHCKVQMVNGKCPKCGMTMAQMKSHGHDH